MKIKRSIMLWQSRLDKTKQYRTRELLLIEKLQKMRMRAVMRGFKDQFRNVSDLAKSLSNLEQMMRTKMLNESFK